MKKNLYIHLLAKQINTFEKYQKNLLFDPEILNKDAIFVEQRYILALSTNKKKCNIEVINLKKLPKIYCRIWFKPANWVIFKIGR